MSSPAGTMFSSLFREFSEAETGVFWDLDDCPIPNDLNPGSIYANIKSSLKEMGYSGRISIVAYSTRENINTEEFAAFNITLKQPDSLKAKLKLQFQDVYMWGISHRDEPTNLMVITEDISEDVHFVEALVHLNKKDNNLLLCHPQNTTSGVLLYTATSFWLWSSLSIGGSPISKIATHLHLATPTPTPCLSCTKQG